MGDPGVLAPAVARTTSRHVSSRDRPDVVHAHGPERGAGQALAAALGVPLVTSDDDRPPLVVLAPDGRVDGAPDDALERFDLLTRHGAHAVAADLDAQYAAAVAGMPWTPPTPATQPPHVTVVVPTHARPHLLTRTLDALAAQTWPDSLLDVVVVDDASPGDATARVCDAARETFGERLTVLRNDRNLGAGASRNRGVAASRGDVVAFTDDDCVPVPAWVELLATAFRAGVGLVQGATRPDPAVPVGPTDRSQWTTAPLGLYETCNVAYRREVLDDLEGPPFDAALQARIRRHVGSRVAAHGFGEDTDLGWRVRELGAAARFVGDALVHHHVFTDDLAHLLRRSLLAGAFPVLVERHPGLRDSLLWRRWFLGRQHLLLLLAAAGLATRRPAGALAVAPYAVGLVDPGRPGRRHRLRAAPVRALRDVVEVGALAYGSARARTLVL